MKKRFSFFLTRIFLIVIFLTAMFFLCTCTAKAQGSPSSEMTEIFANAGLRLMSPRPNPREFALPIAGATEENLSLGQLKGKVVFLNFWATWCPPCRDEMPSMESLYRRYKEDGLEILAVNIRESPEQVHAFMNDYGLTFPALLDINGRVSTAYGVQAIPTSFIIDRDGQIAARLVGSIDWDTPQVRAAFESLLK